MRAKRNEVRGSEAAHLHAVRHDWLMLIRTSYPPWSADCASGRIIGEIQKRFCRSSLAFEAGDLADRHANENGSSELYIEGRKGGDFGILSESLV